MKEQSMFPDSFEPESVCRVYKNPGEFLYHEEHPITWFATPARRDISRLWVFSKSLDQGASLRTVENRVHGHD